MQAMRTARGRASCLRQAVQLYTAPYVLNMRQVCCRRRYCCLAKERTADAKWLCEFRCSSASPRFKHADHQPHTSRQYHSGCSRQFSGPIDSRGRAELHRKLHWKVPMGRIGGSCFRQTAIVVHTSTRTDSCEYMSIVTLLDCAIAALARCNCCLQTDVQCKLAGQSVALCWEAPCLRH